MIAIRCNKLNLKIISSLIDEKLWTWAELARQAGISSSTIFSLKSGRRNASYTTIRKIAHVLKVEPQQIILR